MEAAIEEIKKRLDIVDFISQYVEVKKSGRNFKALCPFHQEKSPSFVISPDRQIWHCFGTCGEGGDVIKFYMKRENLTFMEAMRELAERTGVKLENVSLQDDESKKKEKVIAINTLAAKYFSYLLKSSSFADRAREYLHDREINDRIINTFELGYAPSSWDSLLKFLQKKKFSQEDIIMSGLVVTANGKIYDRFRNRLVFPIKDHRGIVIGFSGRLLDSSEKQAKYVNTPETPVYHKRESLYGIQLTKDAIKKLDNVYIVEGEFDMIYPFQKGIENIVAIKGSALTKEQLSLLKRYTNKITLALDTDEAGIEAMKRGIKEAEQFEFDIRVARFTKGKDPDEAARADYVTFTKELEAAVPLYDFLFDVAKEKYPEATSYNKKKIADELTPFLREITNPIVQAHYVKKLSLLLDVNTESIEKMMKFARKKSSFRSRITSQKSTISRDEMREKYLFSYIFQHTSPKEVSLKIFANLTPNDFSLPALRIIAKHLTVYIGDTKDDDQLINFVNSIPAELRPVVNELYMYKTSLNDLENEKIWNIVYEIMYESYKKLHLYYASGSEEDDKKSRYYKDLLNSLNKSELEKALRTL